MKVAKIQVTWRNPDYTVVRQEVWDLRYTTRRGYKRSWNKMRAEMERQWWDRYEGRGTCEMEVFRAEG